MDKPVWFGLNFGSLKQCYLFVERLFANVCVYIFSLRVCITNFPPKKKHIIINIYLNDLTLEIPDFGTLFTVPMRPAVSQILAS